MQASFPLVIDGIMQTPIVSYIELATSKDKIVNDILVGDHM